MSGLANYSNWDKTQQELNRIQGSVGSMREAIMDHGVDVPVDVKLADIPEYIAKMQGHGKAKITLDNIKIAINSGVDIKIGTEVSDTYDGVSNPWIVAQYYDGTGNYGTKKGYFLIRKYATAEKYAWGSKHSYAYYLDSDIAATMKNDYPTKCSDAIKNITASISLPFAEERRTIGHVSARFFVLSDKEVGGTATDGMFFDYFKTKFGNANLSSESSFGARHFTTPSGTTANPWLRSSGASSPYKPVKLDSNGSVNQDDSNQLHEILVGCFIQKETA